jgi:hypothetical protein
VRQFVFYRSNGKPALNMKLRIEAPIGQQITVHTAKWITRHFGKEISRASSTLGARRRLERKSASLSARYRHGGRRVKSNSIGFAMNGLAVVAMADVLRNRLASQLNLDDTATTSNMGDDCH